jgi:phospholipid-binding lipoprotein MlaA
MVYRLAGALALTFMISASTLAQVTEDLLGVDEDIEDLFEEELVVSDPLQGLNRVIFAFNDVVYMYGWRPLKIVYRVVPEPIRDSVSSFFSNLSTPVRFANSVLQLKLDDAGREAGRFLINSTMGIGGLFDPAGEVFDIARKSEDFGQTLGVWGLGAGPYVVLPILGPSSLRDAPARWVDTWFDPAWYLLGQESGYYAAESAGVAFNDLSLDADTYEEIRDTQVDPYLFIRDAYIQNRAARVAK